MWGYLYPNLDVRLTVSQDDLTKTRPLFPFPALQNAATTKDVAITFHANESKINLWWMNEVSFRANYDHPVFLLAAAGNTSYPYDPVRKPLIALLTCQLMYIT